MTWLSVNINKIATLRNSRGGNRPDLIKMAMQPALPVKPEPVMENQDPRSPTRKVYDTITHGAAAAGGALVSGVAGLNSLDIKGPVKTI